MEMEGFNNDFTSLTSVKRSPVANPLFNDAGGNNENEPNPEMASKFKKQLPSKNFMNPTISAANKTAFPKKKILAERNQTLDVVDQTSLLRSSSFDSKAVKFPVVEADDYVEKDFVGKSCLQPYDPIKNYLSPRPKFLRYNPDRRRKIFNEDGVKSSSSSSSFDSGITSFGLELREDSSGSTDSCSQKEPVEEAMDMIDKEDDTGSCSQKEFVEEAMDMIEIEDEGEDDEEDETEEEMVEFGEDKGCGLKGFLKFFLVVIALISTTQAICSMNSPTPSSQSLESVWEFNGYGKRWSYVHGVAGLNFSEVRDPIMESDLVVERLKDGEVYHDYQGLDAENEVENDETDVIQDAEIEVVDQDFNQDGVIAEIDETAESEVIEIPNVEAEIEVLDQDFDQDCVIEEEEQSDANEKNTQLIIDDIETAKDMEDGIEEIDELETTDVLIGLAGFDLIVSVLIGVSVLILTSFGIIYHSKWMKMKPSSPIATTMVANEINLAAEKEDIKNPEPSPSFTNSASLVENPMPKDVSKEISRVHAPTVELLGEFVFGGEATSSSFRTNDTKGYTISASAQPTTETRSSHIETPMGDSLRNTAEKTVKKPRRKIAEVTPSPVRRSSRIQNRPAIMSP